MKNYWQRAVQAARSGDKELAQRMLYHHLKANPDDADGWCLLSFVVDDLARQEECLVRSLAIDRQHKVAVKRLPAVRSRIHANIRLETAALSGQKSQSVAFTEGSEELAEEPYSQGYSGPVFDESELGYLGQALTKELNNLWRCQYYEGDREYDLVRYLIEDVVILPIIASVSQEMLLGMQLKARKLLDSYDLAPERTEERGEVIDVFFCLAQDILDDWERFEQFSIGLKIPHISFSSLLLEILSAHQDIYRISRSKIRRNFTSLSKVGGRQAKKALDLLCITAERLSLLPGKVLEQAIQYENQSDTPAQASQLSEWLRASISHLELANLVEERIRSAKHKLVTGYLRYAVRVARNYVDNGLPFVDLVQAGFVGLLRAVENFDYRQHARFGTYASTWIWQNVSRTISNDGRFVRIPVHLDEAFKKQQLAGELLFALGYYWLDSDDDLLQNLDYLFLSGLLSESDLKLITESRFGVSRLEGKCADRYLQAVHKARRLAPYLEPPLSLEADQPNNHAYLSLRHGIPKSECQHSLANYLVSSDDQFERVCDLELRKAVEDAFDILDQREKTVVKMRYGFDGGDEKTLQQVGVSLGLSRERIRQIEAMAMVKLKRRMTGRSLSQYTHDEPHYNNIKNILASEIHLPYLSVQGLFDIWASSENQHNYLIQDWDWLDRLIQVLPAGDWHSAERDKSAIIDQASSQEGAMEAVTGTITPASKRPLIASTRYDKAIRHLNNILWEVEHDTGKYRESINDRDVVFAIYQPIFSPKHIPDLTPEEFDSFLQFKNNAHWNRLHYQKNRLLANMDRLRNALSILVNESQPVKLRLNKIRPRYGRPLVPGFGSTLITAILLVSYPEKYGVSNSATESAMKEMKIWPTFKRGAGYGDKYVVVNNLLLRLAESLGTDLWTLDLLWSFQDSDLNPEMEDGEKPLS